MMTTKCFTMTILGIFTIISLIGCGETSSQKTGDAFECDADQNLDEKAANDEAELAEPSEEIVSDFDSTEIQMDVDADNFVWETEIEQLKEIDELESAAETHELKMPEFKDIVVPKINTEATDYFFIPFELDDGRVAVLWANSLGLRFRISNESHTNWDRERLFTPSVHNELKSSVSAPLTICPNGDDQNCRQGDPLPDDKWNINVGLYEKEYGLSKMMPIWEDIKGVYHLPFFLSNSLQPSFVDARISNDNLNPEFIVIEDLGAVQNKYILGEGKYYLNSDIGYFDMDWGLADNGCGAFYYVKKTAPQSNYRNSISRRWLCGESWSEEEQIYVIGAAEGIGDDEGGLWCECPAENCDKEHCLNIDSIHIVRDSQNRLKDTVVALLNGGNTLSTISTVLIRAPKDGAPSSIVLSSSRNKQPQNPAITYTAYEFSDNSMWLLYSTMVEDNIVLYAREFDLNEFKGEAQSMLKNNPSLTYLKYINSISKGSSKRLTSFLISTDESKQIDILHVHAPTDLQTTSDKYFETISQIENEDGYGLFYSLTSDRNNNSIMAVARKRHPFNQLSFDSYTGPLIHNLCVYAENDQGIRENIGCPINDEGFHWNYGAAAWLEDNSNELPVLLMGGSGGLSYFSMIDTADESHVLKMFPYSQIPPSGTMMSNGLNGARDLVAATPSELETLLLRLDSDRKLKINKIIHSDDIQEAGCGVMSVAGDLLRFRCRGSDLYSNFTYTTILCDADGNCSQPRPFSIDGYEVWGIRIFKRSGDYVAVYRDPLYRGAVINFRTWKSEDGGITWNKLGDDFFGFGQFLSPTIEGFYKDGLAGVNILAFENGTEMEYVLKGFTLDIGSGGVKWGNAELKMEKTVSSFNISVGNNGKILVVWTYTDEGSKINSVLYDLEKDEFSDIDSVDLNLDGDISAVKPFINDAGYCVAIEYIVAAAENVGPQQTKTIWGCNKW